MSKKKHNVDATMSRLSDLSFLTRAKEELKMAFWLFQQRDVPIIIKLIPIVAALYVILPVDIIPDFFPLLGQLDDVALFMLGIRAFMHLAPPEVIGRYEADNIIIQEPTDKSSV